MSTEFPQKPGQPQQEWPDEKAERIGPSFEVIGTFSTPNQTEEIDFKQLLDQPLFNRNFYRTGFPDSPNTPFEKLVLETSVPFTDIPGREYQETLILKDQTWQEVMTMLDIEPISLNEWRYLFSHLTEERLAPTGGPGRWGGIDLYRHTIFFVMLDDGSVQILRAAFSREGGPYAYSLVLHELDTKQYFDVKHARVILPTKQGHVA